MNVSASSAQDCWLPIETAPLRQEVLVYWPRYSVNEDWEPIEELVGEGHVGISISLGGGWEDDDVVESCGPGYDDDYCFMPPTHWQAKPEPPKSAFNG